MRQSDGISSFGDVVLDSFNKAIRVEDQTYEEQICSDFLYKDFNYIKLTKMYTYIKKALKLNFISFGVLYYFRYLFS